MASCLRDDAPEDILGIELEDKEIFYPMFEELEETLDDLGYESDEWCKKFCEDAFKRYRYIIKEEMFFDTVTGQKYTSRQFNTVVPGNFPVYRKPQSIDYGKASRAFLEGSFYKGLKGIRSEINSTRPSGHITDDMDGSIVNTFVKRGEPPRRGKVDLFHKLMEVLFEHEEDRQLMLKIMKWTIEHAGDPEKRLMFAPFITGIEGNGKSTIVNILAQIIGERYLEAPTNSIMKSSFSGFLQNALLININESEEAKNNALAEKLKPWITEKFLTIHPKGKEAFKVLNAATFIITTNNANALMQTSGSTRFCNFDTRFESQEELYQFFGSREAKDSFYEELYEWLDKKYGYAKIHNYLKNKVTYGSFKGNKGRAPYTKSHDAILAKQKSNKMKDIEECIELLGGVFTNQDLAECMKKNGFKQTSSVDRDKALDKLDYYQNPQGKFFHQVKMKVYSKWTNKRLAFPASISPKEAGALYVKLKKERGDEI